MTEEYKNMLIEFEQKENGMLKDETKNEGNVEKLNEQNIKEKEEEISKEYEFYN